MKNRKWIIFAAGTVVVAALLGSMVLYVPNAARAERQDPPDETTVDQVLEELNAVDQETMELSRLRADLQIMRTQILLFEFQNERMPGFAADGSFRFERFEAEMLGTEYHGPYLEQIPANPFVEGPASGRVKAGPASAPRDGSSGWWFDTRRMTLRPNDSRSPADL